MTNRVIDTNGWIEIKNNPITRVGVFPYLGSSLGKEFIADKIYNVYRPAEELSKSETIDSFKLLPWTNDHPAKLLGNKPDLLPAEYKGIDGVIGEEIVFDGDFLRGNIKIFSNNLANEIESGKIELSPGYIFKCEIKSGEYQGKRYEIVQRDIRGNHLASVDEGRTGPELRVLDKAEESLMKTEAESEGGEALSLSSVSALLKGLETKIDSLTSRMDAMTAAEKEEIVGEDKKGMDEEDKEKEEKEAKDKKGMDEEYDDKDKTKEAKDEDNEEKKDDKKEGSAMDAALIRKSIFQEMAEKESLVKQGSTVIGVFDASDKTLAETAEYLAKRLGIQCKKEQAQFAVKAFLAGRASNKKTIKTMDTSPEVPNQVHAYLGRK